ncbi:MAG TPA: hypothetical protein VGM83_17270 [Devosiaceae bacterium]|jgi:hypothetical protein
MHKFRPTTSPLFAIAIWACLTSCTLAFEISGITVGDPVSKMASIGEDPVAKDVEGPLLIQRFELPGGNQLSVTSDRDSGLIDFIEIDWSGEAAGQLTDIPGVLFGRTTLTELRALTGSNGFVRKQNYGGPDSAELISLNSYEDLDHKGQEITFVTRGPMSDAAHGVLDSLIFASSAFLDDYWGSEKLFDTAYRPIPLDALAAAPTH